MEDNDNSWVKANDGDEVSINPTPKVDESMKKHESPEFNMQKFDKEQNGGEIKAGVEPALYESM